MNRRNTFIILTIALALILGFTYLPLKQFHEATSYGGDNDTYIKLPNYNTPAMEEKLFADYSFLEWYKIDWPVAIILLTCISYISAIISTIISFLFKSKIDSKERIKEYIPNASKSEALKIRAKHFLKQFYIALIIYFILIQSLFNASSDEISVTIMSLQFAYFPAIFFSISFAILIYYIFVDSHEWIMGYYKVSIDSSSNLVYKKPINPATIILFKLLVFLPLFLVSVQHLLYIPLWLYTKNDALRNIRSIIYFIPIPEIYYILIFYIISLIFLFSNKLHKTLFEFLFNLTPLKNDEKGLIIKADK